MTVSARWVGGLLLLLVACDGGAPAVRGDAPGGEATKPKGGEPVTLRVMRAQDGRRTLEIKNEGPDAFAVLAAGFDGVNRLGPAIELTAKKGADGAYELGGQILVDDPGPQARMPMPDRFELEGGEKVTCLPGLLPPGQMLRVEDVGGDLARKEAFCELARVPAAGQILRLGAPTREAAPPPNPGSRGMGGWAAVATLRVTATPLEGYDGAAADRPAPTWPGPPKDQLHLGSPLALPPLRAYAAPTAALAGWARERKAVPAP